MVRYISPSKVGLSVGAILALWHVGWVALVATGWAKPVLDYILKLHFIDVQYGLAPFEFVTASALVALTFVIGCLIGAVFALIWNWLARPPVGTAANIRPAART